MSRVSDVVVRGAVVACAAMVVGLVVSIVGALEAPGELREVAPSGGVVAIAVVAVAGAMTGLTWSRAGWWARTAVVTVVALCALLVTGAVVWLRVCAASPDVAARYHALRFDTPALVIGVVGAVAVIAAAGARRWRSGATPRWLVIGFTATVTFTATLGVWLALYADQGGTVIRDGAGAAVERGAPAAALFAVPAAVAAAVVALVTWGGPRVRTPLVVGYAAAWLAAMACAAWPHDRGSYEERLILDAVPVLAAAALIAVAHAVAFGVAHARAVAVEPARPAPWRQVGVVEDDGAGPVAWFAERGWLTGGGGQARGFTLRTDAGALRVPPGAAVIGPAPEVAVGVAAPVLMPGTAVEVSGFVAAAGAGVYRASSMPVPGTAGMVVRTAPEAGATAARAVVLRIWRPCLAALVVSLLAAAPALVSQAAAAAEPYWEPPDEGVPTLAAPTPIVY